MTDVLPWVPGVEDQLGWGINIFGSYFPNAHHPSSKLQNRLIDATASGATEETTINGVTYKKPLNVAVDTGRAFTGSAHVFDSKSKVVEHWQEEASIKGSFGAFSGGIKESYQSSSQSETEQYYCMYEASSLVYSLEFTNPAITMVPKAVQDDPDFAALISLLNQNQRINDANRSKYFRFFYKYGTHIITSVQMGGYLNYYASVASSYSQSTQDVSAQVTAEYGALFSGSASGGWSRVSDQWMSSRSATIMGYGGNPASKLVSDIFSNWGKNSDFAADFNQWVSSIPGNPSPVGFTLYPVSNLFAAQQSDLMNEAYQAYANAQVSVNITGSPPGISVSWRGQALQGVPQPETGQQGDFWVLIDRSTGNFQVVLQPTVTKDGSTQEDVSKTPDVVNNKPVGSALVLFCLYVNPINSYNGPTEPLLSFLRNCGAGDALDQVLQVLGQNEGIYAQGYYCLLGQIGGGPQTGAEFETLTQPAKYLNWQVPIIPEWDGQNVLYSVLNW